MLPSDKSPLAICPKFDSITVQYYCNCNKAGCEANVMSKGPGRTTRGRGGAFANRVFKRWVDDYAPGILSERVGKSLLASMLRRGAEAPMIEATLNTMAGTCEARLMALHRAALGPGGHT
jgi:hypothetical protein